MRLRILPGILLAPVLLFSCKKDNAVIDNTNGSSNNNNVVYNVNKATLLQLVNDLRKKDAHADQH